MLEYQIWLIFAVVCFIGELLTTTFFLMSFGLSASICSILSYYYKSDPITNFIVFVVLSVVFIFLSRPFAKFINRGGPDVLVASERLIGEKVLLKEDVKFEKSGFVTIKGDTWVVTSDEDIKKGEEVEVIGIDGVKLVVKKV